MASSEDRDGVTRNTWCVRGGVEIVDEDGDVVALVMAGQPVDTAKIIVDAIAMSREMARLRRIEFAATDPAAALKKIGWKKIRDAAVAVGAAVTYTNSVGAFVGLQDHLASGIRLYKIDVASNIDGGYRDAFEAIEEIWQEPAVIVLERLLR